MISFIILNEIDYQMNKKNLKIIIVLFLFNTLFYFNFLYAQDKDEYTFQKIVYSFNKNTMHYDTSISYFKLQWTSKNDLIFIDSVRNGKQHDSSYVIGKYIVEAEGIKMYTADNQAHNPFLYVYLQTVQ